MSESLLVSHRAVVVDELGATIASHALLHPHYRINAVHNENVVAEDALAMIPFQRVGRLERPIATILLDGAARISAHGEVAWLEPGDVLAMDSKGAIVMRQEGPRYASLVLEWDEGWLGARPAPFARGTLSGSRLAEANAHWAALRQGDARAPFPREVISLFDLGLVARTDAELHETPTTRAARLSAALDVCFSNLRDQPMMSDLERELGLSTRHLNRLVLELNARYGFNATGWRDARNRRRLLVGMCLMTSPNATAEVAARAVGYQSASAFTAALGEAGFPPPSAIAGVVAAFRETGVSTGSKPAQGRAKSETRVDRR